MKIVTASDAPLQIVNYTSGVGSYTTAVKVAALLGISDFTADTSPTLAEVGDLIRRCEDYIDEMANDSWRDNLVENEFHDFFYDASGFYRDEYVGKIRLHNEYIRKIIRLAVWDGDRYRDLASAVATVKFNDFTDAGIITLTAGNESARTWELTGGTGSFENEYNIIWGKRTAAQELCYLINEQAPTVTAEFTGATQSKALKDITNNYNISKFFYANLEDDDTVTIVSLLPGSDGTNCTISSSSSSTIVTPFTDKEEYSRTQDWWDMKPSGDIFFRSEYPLRLKHSVKATYKYGNITVPAVIEDAATKLVCCELIASDDSYTLLDAGGSQSGIDLKSKYDSYKADVDKILKLKKRVMYYLDGM